jgi:PAS domain S-box-containing protein/diguanylate cyclase (GGDEF)-like protein
MSPGQAEAQLAALIGATDDAIVATDAAGRITSFSPGAERLCGVRAQDVVGRRADTVVPVEGAERARELLACVAGGGGPTRLETHWPAPDGRVLRIELALAPIHGTDGIEGVSIVGRDVTARHAAERALRESRERARIVVESAPDPFVAMDEAGRIAGWNAASERMFGWSQEEALGRPLADVVPAHRARLEEDRLRVVADGPRPSDGAPLELVARHRDGTSFPVELALVPVRMGGRWVFNGFVRDLRLRDEAERARRRLAAIVESTGDAVLAEDAEGRITSWNEGAERLFGWPAEEVVGRSFELVVPPGARSGAREMRARVLAGEHLEQVEAPGRHRDGTPLEVALTMSPVRAEGRGIVGVSVIARDIGPRRRADRAERAAQAERLRRATLDELTGLPSRRGFAEHVEQAVRAGAAATVAVVDVARFHALNDALGRAGGDAVLRAVAAALTAALPGAVLGRLEADRFAVLLTCGPDAAADVLAEALDLVQAGGVVLDDLTLDVDLAAGYAGVAGDGTGAEELVGRAERALRTAKARRTGLERYDGPRDDVEARAVPFAAELRGALERDELVMHFQPQLDLATGRIVSAEALVRWQHPERGLLLPGAFLPRVEQAGLMRRITIRALDRALAACRAWREGGLRVPVAVNLSVLNLLDMEIAYEVARLLGRHALSADHLRLEITEDTLMADPERAGAVLAGLDAMGVDLAIDDFGTGHSSLAYLQRLPVEELKIDRCFVGELDHGANAAIVRATIDLGHALGLRVVAEGVESAGTLAALTGMGCDLAQGFHIGRPVPADALAAAAREAAPAAR